MEATMPWCEACKSYHVTPKDKAHHKELQCFAPWKPDPLKQLEEEIKAIKPEEYPVCPGCGEKHPQDDHPGLMPGLNILDMAKGAGEMLNSIPVNHAVQLIGQFVGSFAEMISEETWAKILAHKFEPCGEEGCDCHLTLMAFLPELHKLKVTATEGRKRGNHPDEEEHEQP